MGDWFWEGILGGWFEVGAMVLRTALVGVKGCLVFVCMEMLGRGSVVVFKREGLTNWNSCCLDLGEATFVLVGSGFGTCVGTGW